MNFQYIMYMCWICRSAPYGIAPSSFFLDKCTTGPLWMCGPWASRPETVMLPFLPIEFCLFPNKIWANQPDQRTNSHGLELCFQPNGGFCHREMTHQFNTKRDVERHRKTLGDCRRSRIVAWVALNRRFVALDGKILSRSTEFTVFLPALSLLFTYVMRWWKSATSILC